MLIPILRMPFDTRGDLHLCQLQQRCLQAAERIENNDMQNDKLARYLLNNHGDIVKTDDIKNEDAVDWAIRVMEVLSDTAAKMFK